MSGCEGPHRFFPTIFSGVPNRCMSDQQQLPETWAPKGPRPQTVILQNKRFLEESKDTFWTSISHLLWIYCNDTDTEIPPTKGAPPEEKPTTAQVSTFFWLFATAHMCRRLQCHSPVLKTIVYFLSQVSSFTLSVKTFCNKSPASSELSENILSSARGHVANVIIIIFKTE